MCVRERERERERGVVCVLFCILRKKGVIEAREVYGVYRWIDSGDGEFGVLGCGGGAALVDDL